MKNTGILRIQAFGARQSSPIEGVLVTVSGNGFTAQRITDETGTAADLSIEAPSCALSLQEDNTIRPYAVVDLTAAKAGFRTVRIQGVQIFAGQVTLAQPEMIPETEEDLHDDMIKWSDNSDVSQWFYLDVQEATNSHDYSDKSDADKYEKWTKIRDARDWTLLEK